MDESPEGQAQRLRQEQERAKRRAEKLGILVDSYGDFEVDAGTAGATANMVEQEQEQEQEQEKGKAPAGDETRDGDSQIASTVAAAGVGATAGDAEGQEGGEEAAEEGEGKREEEEEAKAKAEEKRLEEEEEERKARAELKGKILYGQEMSAIAMGHPEAAQGPGKLMSMGSSSYVMDMVRRTDQRKLPLVVQVQ